MRRRPASLAFAGFLLLAGLAWLASGFYSLTSGEQALILRFGKVTARQVETGSHYHLPWPVETIERSRVSEVMSVALQDTSGSREFISGDANLVMVSALVSYDVADLERSRFVVTDLARTLETAGQQCLCRELARVGVDAAMTGGQTALRRTVRDSLQSLSRRLELGVRIISVELTEVSPPPTVAEAFNQVASARTRKQEIVQEARGYAGSVVPRSRGEARKIVADAQAFASEALGRARSDSASFDRLIDEYRREPEITRRLLWLQTLEEIFAACKVQVDPSPEQTIYYLPGGRRQALPLPAIPGAPGAVGAGRPPSDGGNQR